MKKKRLLVTHMGLVYSISRANLATLLPKMLTLDETNISSHRAKLLGSIDYDLTDLDQQRCEEILANLQE